MRIKFLSVIVSFLFVSFAITSCLDNDNAAVEYSTDAIIRGFEIDSAKLGKIYRFTINQLAGEIYNQDSLPQGADTIIVKTMIRTLTTASGYVVLLNKAGTDSIKDDVKQGLNTVDSFDLRNPIRVKVLASEAVNQMYQGVPESQYKKFVKTYTIRVNVRQQDPDSLDWGKEPIAVNYAPTIDGAQKSVILNNEIFVYAENSPAYFASTTQGGSWQEAATSGLPTTRLTSLLNFKNTLYATTGDKKVYQSTNGKSWIESPLSGDVLVLIAPIGNLITGIKTFMVNGEEVKKFCTTTNLTTWEVGETVPVNFPYDNISATTYENSIGVPDVMIVGNTVNLTGEDAKNDTTTVAWGFMEGREWAELSTTSTNHQCPKLKDPSIIRYNDAFYIFGKDSASFYTSFTGIVWKKADKKFLLPESFKATKPDYSMVVDDQHFIWIMQSKPNEVWRGRLNSLAPALKP